MTTHFTSHFRRPIGVLAGLALLASLLVAVPPPIKAQDPAPDYLASFDACPEDVIPGRGLLRCFLPACQRLGYQLHRLLRDHQGHLSHHLFTR